MRHFVIAETSHLQPRWHTPNSEQRSIHQWERRPELQIPAQLYVLLSGDLVMLCPDLEKLWHLKIHISMENYQCDLYDKLEKTWGARETE